MSAMAGLALTEECGHSREAQNGDVTPPHREQLVEDVHASY